MVSSAVWSIGLVPATTTASLRTPRLNTIVANLAVSPMSVDRTGAPPKIEWSLYSVKKYLIDAMWSQKVSY